MLNRTNFARHVVRAAVVISAVCAVSACAPIPERALANGRAMTQSQAFRSAASGNMSVRTHQELVMAANPRRLNYREVAYPAFGEWWW